MNEEMKKIIKYYFESIAQSLNFIIEDLEDCEDEDIFGWIEEVIKAIYDIYNENYDLETDSPIEPKLDAILHKYFMIR